MREGAMSASNPPFCPSLPWRTTSSMLMGVTGALSRAFLYGLNNMEVTGLDKFLEILDKRKDVKARDRGLITGKEFYVFLADDMLMVAK